MSVKNKQLRMSNILLAGNLYKSHKKEWSDIDDISHVYGPSIENETIDQYLKSISL